MRIEVAHTELLGPAPSGGGRATGGLVESQRAAVAGGALRPPGPAKERAPLDQPLCGFR